MLSLQQLEAMLGPEQEVDADPLSGDVIFVGRLIHERIPEADFAELQKNHDVHYIRGQWHLITKKTMISDLILRHGKVTRVGLGPVDGFKWIQFADRTICCHSSLAKEAKAIAQAEDVERVRCNKEGIEVPRIPKVARGKAYPVTRQAFRVRPKQRRLF